MIHTLIIRYRYAISFLLFAAYHNEVIRQLELIID